MKKENKDLKQYFQKKRLPIWYIVFVCTMGVCILLGLSVLYFYYSGKILLAGAVFALLMVRPSRAKDSDVDGKKDILLSQIDLTRDEKSLMMAYDPGSDTVRCGKDGTVRSACYTVTTVSFEKNAVVLKVKILNLLTEKIATKEYRNQKGEPILLVQTPVTVDKKNTVAEYLSSANWDAPIPVSSDNYLYEELIQKVCAFSAQSPA